MDSAPTEALQSSVEALTDFHGMAPHEISFRQEETLPQAFLEIDQLHMQIFELQLQLAVLTETLAKVVRHGDG